jgi:SAM-dependent methyltransferase
MNRHIGSLPASYFDDLYSRNRDPWNFAKSKYERAKYHATLQALPRGYYQRGLEIGCSIGVLTSRLASRCKYLVAIDASAVALRTARRRCSRFQNVQFKQMTVPVDWPAERFDLMILSEVIYYLGPDDVVRLAGKVRISAGFHGHAVLVHWTGPTDYPLSGDEAVELFMQSLGPSVRLLEQRRTPEYRLDAICFR